MPVATLSVLSASAAPALSAGLAESPARTAATAVVSPSSASVPVPPDPDSCQTATSPPTITTAPTAAAIRGPVRDLTGLGAGCGVSGVALRSAPAEGAGVGCGVSSTRVSAASQLAEDTMVGAPCTACMTARPKSIAVP